jgi:hypothetical protein
LDRGVAAVAFALAVLTAGCGGGGGGETTVAVACNDAAFRGQDEELYVTKTAVSNAAGGGTPATLLLDLQRARRALGGYLAAHPPCAEDLRGIAITEQTALQELDAAIAALEAEEDAGPNLTKALASLRSAQSALIAGQ